MADSHHERCDGVNPLLREDTLRWEEGKAMEASRSSETCRLDDTRCQSNERRGEFDHMGRPPSEEQSEARERQRSRDADSNPMQDDCELGCTSGPRSQGHGKPRKQQISERWQGEERYVGEAGFGLIPFPSYAQTANIAGFQLNPRFSLWLMGFPTSWHDAGVSALRSYMEQETPSFPRLRQNSSSIP